jgi:nucleotide-binding universal stress UspA family protein
MEAVMKSVITYVGSDEGFEARFQSALDVVRRFAGHLTIVQPSLARDYVAFDMLGGAHFIAEAWEATEKQRTEMREKVEARLNGEGVNWDWQLTDGNSLTDILVDAARFADLVVLSLDPVNKGASSRAREIVGDVAVKSHTAILAVPPKTRGLSLDRALIAYDGGFEVARAIRAATPLLSLCKSVKIAEIATAPETFPLTDAAHYLARQGVSVDIDIFEKNNLTVEERLLALVENTHPDLLVMGAYGHSRWRETLFGGVTRFILGDVGVPVLLAH